MAEIINGSDLMVFLNGKSIAMATSHTLSVSGDSIDVSNKDLGGGAWAASKVNKLSWTASSDNMYSTTSYNALFNLMVSKQPVNLVFSLKKGTTMGEGGWEPATSGTYSGQAYITSLEANAPDGDNATFSVSFTGSGALTADMQPIS